MASDKQVKAFRALALFNGAAIALLGVLFFQIGGVYNWLRRAYLTLKGTDLAPRLIDIADSARITLIFLLILFATTNFYVWRLKILPKPWFAIPTVLSLIVLLLLTVLAF